MAKKSVEKKEPVEEINSLLEKDHDEISAEMTEKAQVVEVGEDEHDESGGKQKKAPRLSKILTKQNYDYIENISRMDGISIGEYINRLVTDDRVERADEKPSGKAKKKKNK